MPSLTITAASKPPSFARGFPLTIDVKPDTTVAEVKNTIAAKFPKFYPSRQKLTLPSERKPLDDDVKLSTINAQELHIKDLGPQISWRTVFLIEYVGPLIIHPLIYYYPKLVYGQDVKHSALQKYVYAFVMLHFLKRELETMFVHRFSHGTMPFRNVFKNSAHYHILAGLFLALDVYRPKYSATSPFVVGTYRNNETFLTAAAAIWAFAELSNLSTHLTLRNLRPAGTRVRAIPFGYGFGLVSCPNYFFESIGWLVICAMTNSVAAHVFAVFAIYTMSIWAIKKHKNYKKEFGKDYPRGRKAIFPFVL